MSQERRITLKELSLPESLPMPRRSDWGIGMIGFGGIARGAHAPAYRSMGWNIAAIADPDPAAREAARSQFGIERVYDDYRDLLADESVEVIDLLTHPTFRTEAVQAAAQAGKPLISEKPFGQSLEECRRMVETAARAGISLSVHQNYRWMKANYLAHHLIRQGWIGEVFFASIEIYGQQDVGLANHPFYARCDNFLTIQWNNHLADLLRYWTGRDTRRVLARTGRMNGQNFVSDNLLVSLHDFGEGLTGHILHSELLRSDMGGVQCRCDGSEGSILFDFWGSSLRLQSRRLGPDVCALDMAGATYPDSFAGSMGDFLRSLEEGCPSTVSGQNNLATIRTILAEHESVQAGGRWVEV
ncbi:MAG: Gfo/Idh/MocA family oxidoreductase [Armatimonadetes bacterium]|nr:Gfo/Idh/MocA family oxidoreductase [Armatimonadota bacterium]